MTQWFSSDPHFFHEAMFKKFTIGCTACYVQRLSDPAIYCPDCSGSGKIPARPFDSVTDMHMAMIQAHNARVTSDDHWTCLGDVTMAKNAAMLPEIIEVIKQFKGHKRLILGNHDGYDMLHYKQMGFQKISGSKRIDNLLFTHYPVHPSCIGPGMVNVHGHIHTNPAPAGPYINISMEATNYAPVSLDQLKTQAALLLNTPSNAHSAELADDMQDTQ